MKNKLFQNKNKFFHIGPGCSDSNICFCDYTYFHMLRHQKKGSCHCHNLNR